MTPSHNPIEDAAIRCRMFELLATVTDQDVDIRTWDTKHYIEAVQSWMLDHPLNNLRGLTVLPHGAYSAGSVEAIVSFVYRHSVQRRLRFSQAEFVAARIASQSAHNNWQYLEQEPLKANDAVLLSMPFAGTGDRYFQFDSVLDRCDQLGIPVFLDLSYWPISQGLDLNLDRPCVQEVAFSLSKPLATQLRLGLRLNRDPVDDMLQVNSDLKIYNRTAAWVGMRLMQEFSIDWLLSKYLHRQTEVCEQHNLVPSQTFTLATSTDDQYQQFKRNGYNRICITDEITDRW
jgi:hypothetical protein